MKTRSSISSGWATQAQAAHRRQIAERRALWSNSGREIAFFSTARDGVNYDIDIVEPAAGTLPAPGRHRRRLPLVSLDWSPDAASLSSSNMCRPVKGICYVVDLSSARKREVDPACGEGGIAGSRNFPPRRQGVYLISDRDSSFKKLRYVISSRRIKPCSPSIFRGTSRNWRSRATATPAYVQATKPGRPNSFDRSAHAPGLTPASFARTRDHRTMSISMPRASGWRLGSRRRHCRADAYVSTSHQSPGRWTHSEAGPVDTAKFVTPA